ncbi:MAG: ribosomal protein [Parcubacteria group bacterium]|nr:ribosomal protein [Parcubacteria group bacterium]
MKVILLKDIKGLGRRYEEKNVSDGHAINFLIPKKLAAPATGAVAGQIKSLKESEQKHKEADQSKLRAHMQTLAGTEVVVITKANEKNHLFAALTPEKLSEILMKEKGIELDPDCIETDPIKELGTFNIRVRVENEKETHFTLIVKTK